jgi:hypothetical protein
MTTLFDQALLVGDVVNDTRALARAEAMRSLRLLEERLQAVLVGGVLRGLPNLAAGCETTWRGVDVRGRERERPLADVPRLVLAEWGELVLAWREPTRAGRMRVVFEPAVDAELLVEDVARAASAVEWALRRHVERSERLRLDYERAGELARRLGSVLAA